MSHTALRHARKAAAAMVITVAAFGLTACQGSGTDASSPSSSARPTSAGKTAQDSAKGATTGTAEKSGARCTDQINYAGDSRSNAEINTIGEKTGHCPTPEKGDKPSGTPKKPGTSCTDQVNYAGDSRSNAEINTIGEKTGYCPPVGNK
ncbi:hypothetical protein HEP86_35635 [Streptomyces sp. RPA4-5]|uniref:hypothetical protein n=1 Tax=Streptomyces TaxID=1883 RepID=UPI00143EB283|nr:MULTISPECIES: hypothetical protein [Streptomyces]MCX4635742.1 hypothetical protein [Streptomyces platensis]QIY58833.1 hypothetical protein HEP86_35635 [Streptomyces sp. RPA4-5]WJY42114.1 hypothetical protein QT196_35415 [Streptomyces sp. P9-2B-2]